MTTANWKHARTSLPFPDESYCEVVLDARSAAGRMYVGLATGSYNVYSTSPPNTTDSAKRCIYSDSGTFYDFSDTSGTSYTSASLTDVLQVYRKGSNFYIQISTSESMGHGSTALIQTQTLTRSVRAFRAKMCFFLSAVILAKPTR
jgi:hypothetical protein